MGSGSRKLAGTATGLVAAGAVAGLVAAGVFAPLTLAGTTVQPTAPPRSYATCPAHDRSVLTSTARGAAKELVPPGPHQVLLCRYSGLNPNPAAAGRLLAHRLLTQPQTTSELTRRFDALLPFRNRAYSCPADFGVRIIAVFRYLPTRESDDPVTVDPNGCTPVTNGRLTRTAMFPPGPALINQLEREVG